MWPKYRWVLYTQYPDEDRKVYEYYYFKWSANHFKRIGEWIANQISPEYDRPTYIVEKV